MRPKNFTPPKYSETHYCIFDKQSGEIVAIETQWNLVRAKGGVKPTARAALLKSLASEIGKAVSQLDVLAIKELPRGVVAARVNLQSRRLIVEKAAGEPTEQRKPSRLERP
jgi:hypothetical protein